MNMGKVYEFDFTGGFTISDYAVFQRSNQDGSADSMQEIYEVVDKFYVGDLFALDMNEVTEVMKQFADALGKHMGTK